MHPNAKLLFAALVLFYLNSVLSDVSRERLQSTTDSLGGASQFYTPSTLREENATGSSTEGIQEHPAVSKWKKADIAIKQAFSSLYKTILPLLLRGSEDLNISPKCSRGLMKMLNGLKQTKAWAFKMIDSFGKVPNGMLEGNINSLGDYDECINTEVPGHFSGKYCNLDVAPPLPERRPFVSSSSVIPEFANMTNSETITGEFLLKATHYYRLNFRTSICVPSTCSREEVQNIANRVVQLTEIEFDILIPNCETAHDKRELGRSEITIIVVVSIILLISIMATITDVFFKMTSEEDSYQDKLSVCTKYLLCFSFYTNTLRLLKPDNSPDSIKIFHGMKVITILWVILNHSYLYLNYQACSYLINAAEVGKDIAFQFIANGFLNVETFFFISAVLISYGVMKMKEKKVNICLYVFRRIWRLMPPFMFVIALVFLIPYIGSGPVWKETVTDQLTEKCRSTWWTNLLFINNFISTPEMCLQWLWYIPVDTHLYFLSLIVIIPLKSNPRLAFIMNMVMLMCGVVISAAFHVYYGLHPTVIYAFNHPEDVNYVVDRGYFRTYLHTSTYCVGLAVGYFIATRSKIRIPLKVNVIGWLSAFTLALTVLYGVYDWNQGHLPSMGLSVLYACTNKFIWSSALAWVTIACMTGNGGIVTSILSWSVFVPLGRLTYMTYLIHPIIHIIYVGSTRTLIRTEHRTILYIYLGNVVLSFVCAYALSLLFESPFMALEKVMFSRRPARRSNSSKSSEVKEPKMVESITKYKSGEEVKDNSGVYAINIKQMEANG